MHYLAQKKNDLFHGPSMAVHPVQELVDNEEDEREAWKTSNFMNSCCRMDTVIKLIKGVIFVCLFFLPEKKNLLFSNIHVSVFTAKGSV